MSEELINLLVGENDYWLFLLSMMSSSTVDISPAIFYFTENMNHIRMEGFNEEWIQIYLVTDFFNLFRMTRRTFNKLWAKIDGPDFHTNYQGGGIPIPGPTQLLMTIWWLGKGETLISVAERFNTVVSTVHSVTTAVLDKLLDLLDRTITWPKTADEFQAIEEGFRNRCGFPGVIGAVDGSNIKFKAPVANQESYIDKNDGHSIKVQVICTHNKIFTNIVVGFPGSVHDARIFRNCKIYTEINENNQLRKYFPLDDYHIVGDKAYPLSNWVLKPYIGDRQLNERQRIYNYKHSKTRIVVEHSIALLKGRWTILKYINVNSEEKAIKIIAVCCILHNFCYLNGDIWPMEDNPDIPADDNENGGVDNHLGWIKRDRISYLFV